MNIIAVVVLYRCRMDQSPAIASLVRAWEHRANNRTELRLVIYDNSPVAQDVLVALPFEHQYVHDPSNGGLARAYNHTLASDTAGRYQWLLLLDQDSNLPAEFIAIAEQAAATIGHDTATVAAVPRVFNHGTPISPARVLWGGRIRPLRKAAAGIFPGPITAINSGTLIRTSFMADIGGFTEAFPLDYLDHWLFSIINRMGRKVYITEAMVGHDLSIGQRARPVSPERYRSVLQAETLYYRICRNKWDRMYHVLALAVRACRQIISGDRTLRRLTLRHMLDIAAKR